ncbi:hypothetical protein VL806_12945 [Listeria seeligeri]|nr:hypothetical protein [Listeria seeligeri]
MVSTLIKISDNFDMRVDYLSDRPKAKKHSN